MEKEKRIMLENNVKLKISLCRKNIHGETIFFDIWN